MIDNTAINWGAVKGVIFDMDGTLYRKTPMRLRMAQRLLGHALTHPHGRRDVRVISHFRRNREKLADARLDNVSRIQFKATAETCGLSEGEVAAIVREWIEERPLSCLKAARFKDVERVFATLKQRGVKIGVFSDYPAVEKLKALDLAADTVCYSLESGVDRLKPEPAGLLRTVEKLGLNPKECLMIGDRNERDGACASHVDMPFLLCNDTGFYTRLLKALDGNRA